MAPDIAQHFAQTVKFQKPQRIGANLRTDFR